MTSRTACAAALLLMTGCAAGGAGAGRAPPRGGALIAHGMPAATPAVYEHTDTSVVTLQVAGMGAIDVSIATRTVMELAFREAGDGLDVTATTRELDGRMSNSVTGTVRVDDAMKPGPAELRVDAKGDVTLVRVPPFSAALGELLSPEAFYRAWFAVLPGRAVERGSTWTDTLRLTERTTAMTAQRIDVVTSTWAADTVLDGMTLLVILSDVASTVQTAGAAQGVELRQRLTGSTRAVTLWDPARRLVVERTERGEASGTADIAAAGATGLPVAVRSRQTLRLQRQRQ